MCEDGEGDKRIRSRYHHEKKMTAEDALDLYKSRDASEKLFKGDKSYLGNRSMRTQTDESMETKILIEFVALIIRNKIYTCLRNESRKADSKANYMTVPAALKELEKIEMIKSPDGEYRLNYAVCATQKAILKAFGMTSDNIKKKRELEGKELMQAYEKSNRSLEEVLEFLSGSSEDDEE